MIKLYYVRGINRFDTPYFQTKTDQERFFISKQQSEMDDSFYPPHYENRIQISKEDLSYNDIPFNYLSIDFNNKTYYYFVEHIEYVTEDLMNVEITLDVIQTYYFDIFINYIDIEKRLINRWGEYNTINREYVRENLSEGIFVNKYYRNLTDKRRTQGFGGYIIAKTSKETTITELGQPTRLTFSIPATKRVYGDDTTLIMLPAGDSNPFNVVDLDGYFNPEYLEYTFNTNGEPDTLTYTYTRLLQALHIITERSDIVSVYYVPENPFTQSSLEEKIYDGGLVYINVECDTSDQQNLEGIEFKKFKGNNQVLGALNVYSATVDIKTETYSFGFVKNDSKETEWDLKYIPQLLDENYIQLFFGERDKYTSYPLSVATRESDIKMNYMIDPLSGERIYWIGDYDDPYLTTIIGEGSQNVTMWNDYWHNYQATHKGTMSIRPIYETGKFAYNVSTASKTKGFYTPKRRQLSVKGQRMLTSAAQEYIDYAVDVTENRVNLKYSPETIKQMGDYTTNTISKQLDRFYQIQEVKDLDDVGRALEGYGYRVHEHYSNTENIFDIINTRYYYNIIKASNISITLTKLNSNDIIQEIENRFLEGLRLWNVDVVDELCETLFVYDNVEKDYL